MLWNALGRGIPLLIALALTPVLVHLMGTERWGLFTLALALVGIFGVFDLGLGMALTRAVSERIGEGRGSEAPALVGATLWSLLGVSIVMAAIAWWFMPVLIGRVLLVPPALEAEALAAFRVLAAAAPLVVINAALWGVLAAWQRFRSANLVNMPVSVFYYLGPVFALLAFDSLVAVMVALVLVRLVSGVAYAALAWRDVPGLGLARPGFGLLRPLLRQGGWMSLSGALTQVLLYADRFLIGALIGLTAVAFYATPLDLVMRMWILPVAVAQTLLPAIASSFRTAPERTALLLRRGALIVAGWCCRPAWCWSRARNGCCGCGSAPRSPRAAGWCCASWAWGSSSPASPSCRARCWMRSAGPRLWRPSPWCRRRCSCRSVRCCWC